VLGGSSCLTDASEPGVCRALDFAVEVVKLLLKHDFDFGSRSQSPCEPGVEGIDSRLPVHLGFIFIWISPVDYAFYCHFLNMH
jgi:hypothetical protein